jgi:hypothetical protein
MPIQSQHTGWHDPREIIDLAPDGTFQDLVDSRCGADQAFRCRPNSNVQNGVWLRDFEVPVPFSPLFPPMRPTRRSLNEILRAQAVDHG